MTNHINIEEIANESIVFDFAFDHSYAKPYGEMPIPMFYCSKCSFKTTRKNTLVKHEEGSCVLKPVRTLQCPGCEKKYTYDTLRGHFNHYISNNRKHGIYTPEMIENMLKELKNTKKQNK